MKGVDVLLRAVAVLGRDDVFVDIVGDGPHSEQSMLLCRELGIEDKVVFHGSVRNEDLPVYFANAAIYVLSSFVEGSPVAIKEAMASSLPVISTRVGSVPQMVVNGENGFIIDINDHQTLADRLSTLLDDVDLMRSMGLKGKERSASYDLGIKMGELCALLEACRRNEED